jgi:lysozyme
MAMRMTDKGLALIRRFEGFRGAAYRDATGVWTIGYGHTSMAGPPAVARGMTVSRAEAEAILARDVAAFAAGVAALIRVDLGDEQFAALVSFAYNVGLGNFRSSSVLAAVNGRDFAAVPRRLQLWCKAGGRVLPGLQARRAAEGELFAAAGSANDAPLPTPDLPAGKPLHRSSTVAAALAGLAAALAAGIARSPVVWWLAVLLALAAALWIIRERHLKSRHEGV